MIYYKTHNCAFFDLHDIDMVGCVCSNNLSYQTICHRSRIGDLFSLMNNLDVLFKISWIAKISVTKLATIVIFSFMNNFDVSLHGTFVKISQTANWTFVILTTTLLNSFTNVMLEVACGTKWSVTKFTFVIFFPFVYYFYVLFDVPCIAKGFVTDCALIILLAFMNSIDVNLKCT